jgi:ArsR family transcriptional regulator
MIEDDAVAAFAALAHPHRLSVFRILVKAAPKALPAGKIAEMIGAPPSTLSTHLAQLQRSGLIRSTRERQRILYSFDDVGTRHLVAFLVDDCCGGKPELCGYEPAEAEVVGT